MHPYRQILYRERWSNSLSTRPDDPNNITFQSSGVRRPLGTPTSRTRYKKYFPDTYLQSTSMSLADLLW